ncbi:MAG: hypothetical protein ACI9YB_003055 [Halioglobus sp.]|jgi:hypothetical protein
MICGRGLEVKGKTKLTHNQIAMKSPPTSSTIDCLHTINYKTVFHVSQKEYITDLFNIILYRWIDDNTVFNEPKLLRVSYITSHLNKDIWSKEQVLAKCVDSGLQEIYERKGKCHESAAFTAWKKCICKIQVISTSKLRDVPLACHCFHNSNFRTS